jgi:hypothetical protein
MTQPAGDHAILLFSHVDCLGRVVRPPADIGGITRRIMGGFVQCASFNLQAIITTPHRLSAAQRTEVLAFFLKSRDLLCSAFAAKRNDQ